MKYDVFISYSRKDKEIADSLCRLFDKAGVKYWIDRNIHGSANFLYEITQHIRNCKVVVFIASDNAAKSEFTQKEILFALKHHKKVIPYRIGKFQFTDNDELDFVFTNVQWKDTEAEVLDALRILECTSQPIANPASTHKRMLWPYMVLMVIALIFVYLYCSMQKENQTELPPSISTLDTVIVGNDIPQVVNEKSEKGTIREQVSAKNVQTNITVVPSQQHSKEASNTDASKTTPKDCETKMSEEVTQENEALEHILRVLLEQESKEKEIAAKKAQKEAEEERLALMIEDGKGRDGVYQIGDYYNQNGKKGVVFQVSEDGRHGKIISLSNTKCAWCTDEEYKKRIETGATDKNNGMSNQLKIQQIEEWHQKYPAFAWCADLGPGWYLPAIEELHNIFNQKHIVGPTLEKRGTALETKGDWWSSTERSDKPKDAYYLTIRKGYKYDMWKYISIHYVRAVTTF